YIGSATAFCVREGDGPTGAPLVGGMLFCHVGQTDPNTGSAGCPWPRGAGATGSGVCWGSMPFTPRGASRCVGRWYLRRRHRPGWPAHQLYERMSLVPAELHAAWSGWRLATGVPARVPINSVTWQVR